jgi:aminopeptidase N
MARRSLKNLSLVFLASLPEAAHLAQSQLRRSDNMTDTIAALSALLCSEAPGWQDALEAFERRWRSEPLVMDKWFGLQATMSGPGAVERVRGLLRHPAFNRANPNRVRSVLGTFATSNPTGFHARSGEGYRLVADQVIALDALNPQVAARLATAFNGWKRYDPERQALMRGELNRIAEVSPLSPDLAEIVGSALAAS